ncbi:hypothetical protein A9Q96_15635 [Rhodobacterales bacterium 52_120_T64]|nr:hypothetical protein A9Q96_15635 [Rhodobacterales bacterium 52_120_T64]
MFGPLEKTSPRSAFEGREIIVATILSVVWVILLAGYGAGYFGLLGDLAEPRDAAFLEIIFFLIVLILPLAFVWLGSALIRRSFQIQDEARRLEREVHELRDGDSKQNQNGVSQPRIKDNRVETLQLRVTELTNQIKQMETTITSVRQMQAAMQTQATSGSAAAEPIPETTSPTDQPMDWSDLLRALDFPRNEKDAEGFRALRLAKRDEETGQLLRAAEDILNLLSQEGIYMDDLRPEIAPAYDWRSFAEGTRGSDVTTVGGIIAPEAMERIKAREKTDQIFRDSSLYFLRRFDIMLKSFTSGASDAQIQMLADTRSGRAFMLLGRAAGMFG